MALAIFLRFLLPPLSTLQRVGRLLLLAVVGGVLLAPLLQPAPLLGWDWFWFFTRHNPDYNIDTARSLYPPFTVWVTDTLAWLNWRTGLGVLYGLTLITVALGTWRSGGRWVSMTLALSTPPVWFLMWVGQVDGLAMLGVVAGLLPLALIKPHNTVWLMFSTPRQFIWAVIILGLTILIWPEWVGRMWTAARGANVASSETASFGWAALGWPILALGLGMLAGAGSDKYRLLAAGCFISPYVMPYTLTFLLPTLGRAHGWRKWMLWLAAWLVFLGTGLAGEWRAINLLLPLLAYGLGLSPQAYLNNLRTNLVWWVDFGREISMISRRRSTGHSLHI